MAVFLGPLRLESFPEAFSRACKAGLEGSGCRGEAATSCLFVFMLSLHQKKALTPLEKGQGPHPNIKNLLG